ncbi:MAG: ROK family protein [Planctomycetaceae bacterium]|nr:ROK family protein [Planctomycetaceae bacterium]
MTARRVLESLQQMGPLSRADLTRETGISAPTVSKVVAELLETGLLEEGEAPDNTLGRPGRRIQLARQHARVLGVVLDPVTCYVVRSTLEGDIDSDNIVSFGTPASYQSLVERISQAVSHLANEPGKQILGIGISTPGLIDEEQDRCAFSPNLHVINNQNPAADLEHLTGFTAVCLQEPRALCIAERLYGNARGMDDFAAMDITTGLGLGVFSHGDLLRGHNGLACEIGHVTIDPSGRLCGCGNHGCLETLATDSALAAMIAERTEIHLPIEEIIDQIRSGALQAQTELNRVCEYLSIAMSAAINVFNPAALFVHGKFPTISDAVFEQILRLVRRRTLDPAFEKCDIRLAVTDKKQGAVAAIMHHLTCAAGPRVT